MPVISNTERVSRDIIAYLFGVHPSTVSRWTKTGFPRNKDGTFDLRTCITHALTAAEEMVGQETNMEAAEQAIVWLAKFREQRARLSQLECERLEGTLVVAADMEKAIFELARKTRDALLNIPARLAAILAAESDRKRVEEMLDIEMRKALEELPVD